VSTEELTRVDGRTARRERNRAAVIDALFSLIDEGHVPPSTDEIAERIDRLVDARTTLYRSIAPVARLARSRALDNPRLADTLVEVRARFTRQIRDHFAPELATLPRADGNDLVVLVDTLTSFESWDMVRTTHDYSERLVRRAWKAGLAGIIERFVPAGP
jgi:hypothetical protein